MENGAVKTDFPRNQPTSVGNAKQRHHHQTGADRLGKQGSQCCAEHAHIKPNHKQQVQNHIDQTADNQKIQRTPGISDGAKDTGTHVIDQREHNSHKIGADINQRIIHNVVRGIHRL